MAFVNSWSQLHVKFNGRGSGKPFGFSEKYDFPLISTVSAVIALGQILCSLRKNFLPQGIQILSCIAKRTDRPNKTSECLTEPIEGAYGEASGITITSNGGTTINNETVSLGGALNPPVQSDPQDELKIDWCKLSSFFRLESDTQERVIRAFHGIPGVWESDGVANDLPDADSWTTGATITTAPAVNKNLWANYVPFFDWLVGNMAFIRANPSFNPALTSGDNSNRYIQSALSRVVYQKLDDMPVGKPFGLEVGRHF